MSSISTSLDALLQTPEQWLSNPVAVARPKRIALSQAVTELQRAKLHFYGLATCMAIVTFVAVYDTYWSFKTQDILHETEQNPLGTMLIDMDNGDIALFMTCKMLGTMIALLAIPALYWFRKSWGLVSGTALAVCQSLVFIYLTFGHLFV